MLYRPLGRSGLSLSVIGFGSAWLRQVPEEQAIRSLRLAFERGVNFVHTAPDYEGAEDLIARAVAESGKDVIVASQGYGLPSHFEYLFETTRAKLQKQHLDMFGIACLDDRELMGENVWGSGGLVDLLLEKKRRGLVQATFCTTHGSPEYIRRLIESGAFDGIMLAYNPLGYHLLSHPEISPGSGERLAEMPGLFSLAARRGVGLILMKTLAAGLLVPPKALPPHDPDMIPPPALTAGTLFRYLLNRHPEVTCLVAGMTTEAEVRENTAAISAELDLAPAETEAMHAAIGRLRATVCSRCGYCDSLCSKGLRVSWLFRAAHIENSRLMVFETPANLRYFDLHPPQAMAMCSDCGNITCRCPFHIDIPTQLIQVHGTMFDLFRKRRTLPSPAISEPRPEFSAALLGWDRDEAQPPGQIACCRLNVQNTGTFTWEPTADKPQVFLEVMRAGALLHSLPVRGGIGTDVPCQFNFPLEPTEDVGELEFALCLRNSADRKLLEQLELSLAEPVFWPEYLAGYLSHTIPALAHPGALVEAEVVIRNDSQVVWRTDIPGMPLTLVVWVDNQPVCTAVLPQARVKPRESVRVLMNFTLPRRTGPLMIKCDLVRQNVATFEVMGVEPLRLRLEASEDCSAGDQLAPPWPPYGVAVISHAAPENVTPGARFCVRLRMENTGSFTWSPDSGSRHWVNLIVRHRDRVIGFSPLPYPVAPGQCVDVHLTVAAPEEPGEPTLEVGLVHENVALFSDRGVAPWPLRLRVQGTSHPDDRAYELMRGKNAWFYQPSDGAAIGVDGKRSFPVTVTRAKGSYLWDGDGRRIIDYTNAWGTALLGHAYEPVQQAIRNVLDTSVLSPLPYRLEAEVTEMLRDIIPCAESVAFGKNGSDVCTLAIRLARLNTGRTTVLYCGFHGWQDWYMESAGFAGTGVPEPPSPRLHRFRFNDIEDFRKLLNHHRADLAAVILEPSGPSGEPPYGIGDAVDVAFLSALAEITRAAGAILIFDEIITGFRVPGNSIQKATGVIPDLACFGKALANGMPLAALVGRSELFSCMARSAYGPTYKGDLYSLAAAKSALSSYASLPVGEKVYWFGDAVKTMIIGLCANYGIPASVVGPPFRFGLFFAGNDIEERAALGTLYIQELLRGGLLPYKTLFLPCYTHGEDELSLTTSIVRNTLSRIREALDSRDIHSFIEIPIIR